MKKNIIVSVLVMMSVIFMNLWGCSSGGGGGSSTPSATTGPTVVSSSPGNGNSGVATNTDISVTFSEAMDATTLNASTFTLTDSSNNVVSGSVSYNGTTATFFPSNPLNYSTTYTATITTGAKDASEKPMGASDTLTFTTADSPLISASTLKSWIDGGMVNGSGANRVVILDINSAATYSAGHIPGALFVNSTDIYENRKEGPAVDVNMVLEGKLMDALVQKYGIDNNTTVVFTTSSITSATRGYWTFRYWGFPKEHLKLLNGLNTAWAASYPTSTTATPLPTPSTYSVKSNASLRTDLRASLADMITVASGSVANAVILDSRSSSTAGSYAGTPGSTAGVFAPSGDYVVFEGHMKGAKALDYTTTFDPATLQFKSPDVLTTLFGADGIDGTKTTYVHCRTGVIASVPFFILDAILQWPVRDYDGSWSQWGQLSADSANGGQLAAGSRWITDTSLSDLVVYNHATKAVELLTLDGGSCSGTLSTSGTATYSPAGCDSGSIAPDSNDTSGNEVEEEDAVYMGH